MKWSKTPIIAWNVCLVNEWVVEMSGWAAPRVGRLYQLTHCCLSLLWLQISESKFIQSWPRTAYSKQIFETLQKKLIASLSMPFWRPSTSYTEDLRHENEWTSELSHHSTIVPTGWQRGHLVLYIWYSNTGTPRIGDSHKRSRHITHALIIEY